jgi:hypothetical protein
MPPPPLSNCEFFQNTKNERERERDREIERAQRRLKKLREEE